MRLPKLDLDLIEQKNIAAYQLIRDIELATKESKDDKETKKRGK
jgi:hypothetical protein